MWFVLFWISLFSSTEGQTTTPTPKNTSDFRKYRLELFDEGKGYYDAKSVCEGRNAWLVEIKDEETQAAVRLLTDYNIWIGLHHDSGWKWNNICELHYTNWASGRPREIETIWNNFCVASRSSDGKWFDFDCKTGYRYVCQSDKSWIIFNNELTLQIISIPVKTFSESQQACAKSGSTLVEIKTDALNSFIDERLSGNINFWTSGSDLEKEGSWKWGDGTAIDINDKNWKKWSRFTEPNGGSGENCLLKFASADFKWTDRRCDDRFGYICQQDVSSGDCGRDVCSDKGTCKVNGKRYKCTCDAGYVGTKCEKGTLFISTNSTIVKLKRGESTKITFQIKSYFGNVNVTVKNEKNAMIYTNKTLKIGNKNPSTTLTVDVGPITVPSSTITYTCVAFTLSKPPYLRTVTIDIVVTDECDSLPCESREKCTYSLRTPYYKCTCQESYIGTSCKERRFVINTAKNCKYHVNFYDKKTFADANSTCKELGGAVAMMKTSTIQDLVESQIINQYGAIGTTLEFWIGGYKVNNTWIWVDGTDVSISENYSKWPGCLDGKTGIMFLSSYLKGERNGMRWFATETNVKIGYICEIAVIDVCSPSPCMYSGTCVFVGCQKICKCLKGFDGKYCEIAPIKMSTSKKNFTINSGETVTVQLNIQSSQGPVRIQTYKDSNFTNAIDTRRNVVKSVEINLGTFKNSSQGTTYTFLADPESNLEAYFISSSITVTVVVGGTNSTIFISVTCVGIGIAVALIAFWIIRKMRSRNVETQSIQRSNDIYIVSPYQTTFVSSPSSSKPNEPESPYTYDNDATCYQEPTSTINKTDNTVKTYENINS